MLFNQYPGQPRRKSFFLFFLFLVFGLYLINSGINLITLPSIVSEVDSWITVISGILLIVGGFLYFMQRRYY